MLWQLVSLWIIPLLSTNSYEGSYFQNICTSYCLAYSVNGLMYMRTYSLDAVTFSEFGLRKHNAKFDSPRWLVFLQLLLKIHTFHQYLEDLDLLEAIFKNFALAVFEAIKRSKVDWYWIWRLEPQNFVIISETLDANLEKVKQASVWQMVPKFWFIWLWYLSFCITYKSKSLKRGQFLKTSPHIMLIFIQSTRIKPNTSAHLNPNSWGFKQFSRQLFKDCFSC